VVGVQRSAFFKEIGMAKKAKKKAKKKKARK